MRHATLHHVAGDVRGVLSYMLQTRFRIPPWFWLHSLILSVSSSTTGGVEVAVTLDPLPLTHASLPTLPSSEYRYNFLFRHLLYRLLLYWKPLPNTDPR